MKELWKRILFAVLVTFLLIGMVNYSVSNRNSMAENMEEEEMQKKGLTLWYTDDAMTEYLSAAAVEFGNKYSTYVDLELVESSDYIDKIASASVTDSAVAPDVYIVRNTLLEDAYVSGITAENTSDKYTEDNYCSSALNSVTYHDKMIAYPLSFHTSCLVYRSDLIEPPANLEQLIYYDTSVISGVAIEKKIDIDTSDVLSDYPFVGNYFNLGGETGDLKEEISFDNEAFFHTQSFYTNMLVNSGIVPYTKEENLIISFLQGTTLSIILNSDYITMVDMQAAENNVAYDLMEIPDMNDSLLCKTGSYTDAVAVNGMSESQQLASQFAQYITYDYVDMLHGSSKLYPARFTNGSYIKNYDKIYEIYKNSTSFPKLLETEDFDLKLGEMFEDVTAGADIVQAADEFSQTFLRRLNMPTHTDELPMVGFGF